MVTGDVSSPEGKSPGEGQSGNPFLGGEAEEGPEIGGRDEQRCKEPGLASVMGLKEGGQDSRKITLQFDVLTIGQRTKGNWKRD